MLREANRSEKDGKTFDKGVICMMLHHDTVSLLMMKSCQITEEGSTKMGNYFLAEDHCKNRVRKCFSRKRATCKNTSPTPRHCRSDALKDAARVGDAFDGVKSATTPCILRLFKSPPTPP